MSITEIMKKKSKYNEFPIKRRQRRIRNQIGKKFERGK